MTAHPLSTVLRADVAALESSIWSRPHVPSTGPALALDPQVQVTRFPNVLIVGSHAAVADALPILQVLWRQPVVTHRPPDAFVLPEPSHAGTVVLRDVARLSLNDQHRLMAWLEANNGRAQIIATDTRPVWPCLQTGEFLPSLYYRLNIVYLDLAR